MEASSASSLAMGAEAGRWASLGCPAPASGGPEEEWEAILGEQRGPQSAAPASSPVLQFYCVLCPFILP